MFSRVAMRGACAVFGLTVVLLTLRSSTAQIHDRGRSLAMLDEEFQSSATRLEQRAAAAGAHGLAAAIRGWQFPEAAARQMVFAIPARVERPVLPAGPAVDIWNEFVAIRRRRADRLFALARAAAAGADGPREPCAAAHFAYRTLRDDPDHAAARAACGWIRHGDAWVWPEAARRLDRGEEYDPRFGWLPPGWLARHRGGERHHRGRWVDAVADDARASEVNDGRRFVSDHWEILSAAPLADTAAVATLLEETRAIWLQVYAGFGMEPAAFGRGAAVAEPPTAREAFAAVLCADRRQYLAELAGHEPRVGLTTGLYWRPTQTLWLCAAGEDSRPETVHHEAAHQLFAELRPARPLAGERCGFWAIEAAACYMESIRPAAGGWTVGGRDAGRVPAARALLLEEDFHVPLAELAGLGRAPFQADPRIERIYVQLAGLADFFMNGERGRHREAFVAYVAGVYADAIEPDTLARRCGASYADLDAAYRRHLSQ